MIMPLLLSLGTLGVMAPIEMILLVGCGQGKQGRCEDVTILLTASQTKLANGNTAL